MRAMEVGVFLSSLGMADPIEAIAKVKELGIGVIQLPPLPEDYLRGPHRDDLVTALKQSGLTISAGCVAFDGEDYSDLQAVAQTVGLTNPATVRERMKRIEEYASFCQQLGVPIVTTHIGVIPEGTDSEPYADLVDTVAWVDQACQSKHVTFALETGQESADLMLQFMADVDSRTLKINFDPANMILYGSGDPIEALEQLKDYVVHVHCKDGRSPAAPLQLGEETRLGEGEVGLDRFVAKLKAINYRGPLVIEREAGEDRIADIRQGKELLEKLVGS